ncbi:MAG: WecB/TagA/CpsF family glycosyltransferase [Bacteroidetes bacterium]|nr:WecB/TagA/CpsF family glycosyltransferase [Bacteroidota bacterium]
MNNKMDILGLQIDSVRFAESITKVFEWGFAHASSYVCFANVHMTMEAFFDHQFQKEVNGAQLVLADGKPIAKACKWIFGEKQERIAGMDFMPRIIDAAATTGAGLFFYGSTPELLKILESKIKDQYPNIKISGMFSPPFRKLSQEEMDGHIAMINQSGANIVLVSLGCPKQEKWMAACYQKINAVMLGVGGAFMVMAGLQKRAPLWMQRWGLEWLYRLSQEPGRLFKRYFVTNTVFIYLLFKTIIQKKWRRV